MQTYTTFKAKNCYALNKILGGRTPVKFVTANANQLGRKVITTKQATPPQVQRITPSLSKVTNIPQQQVRTVGSQQQDGTLHGVVKTTPTAQFVQNSGLVATHVKGLSTGTQFLTATGQKVQIIASSPQNLGGLLLCNVHLALI